MDAFSTAISALSIANRHHCLVLTLHVFPVTVPLLPAAY
jgi:ABC-type transport system involved in cytochrome c biogenesis permease component